MNLRRSTFEMKCLLMKLRNKGELRRKLNSLLNETKIEDLPLDFIGTQYFSDLYLFSEIMGAGSFGVVLKVIEITTKNEFAMKVLFYKNHSCCLDSV